MLFWCAFDNHQIIGISHHEANVISFPLTPTYLKASYPFVVKPLSPILRGYVVAAEG